jgi:outer membrane protein assembly factor BamB
MNNALAFSQRTGITILVLCFVQACSTRADDAVPPDWMTPGIKISNVRVTRGTWLDEPRVGLVTSILKFLPGYVVAGEKGALVHAHDAHSRFIAFPDASTAGRLRADVVLLGERLRFVRSSEFGLGELSVVDDAGETVWSVGDRSGPAVATDLDQDGKVEIVVGGRDIAAYRQDGTRLWTALGGQSHHSLVPLTGDGHAGLLVSTWDTVVRLDAQGRIAGRWSFPGGRGADDFGYVSGTGEFVRLLVSRSEGFELITLGQDLPAVKWPGRYLSSIRTASVRSRLGDAGVIAVLGQHLFQGDQTFGLAARTTEIDLLGPAGDVLWREVLPSEASTLTVLADGDGSDEILFGGVGRSGG